MKDRNGEDLSAGLAIRFVTGGMEYTGRVEALQAENGIDLVTAVADLTGVGVAPPGVPVRAVILPSKCEVLPPTAAA